MKTILCFGDSNTWGFDPTSITTAFPARHPIDVRWTGVLARELGPDFRIIEEGQNGRTTVHHDPFNVARRGLDYLPACLESHKPIDLVVMMLGSNDLKAVFNVPPSEVASGAGVLARMIVTSQAGPDNRAPQLLLLCPLLWATCLTCPCWLIRSRTAVPAVGCYPLILKRWLRPSAAVT
jgi:lysophospholipase L1-like esterase